MAVGKAAGVSFDFRFKPELAQTNEDAWHQNWARWAVTKEEALKNPKVAHRLCKDKCTRTVGRVVRKLLEARERKRLKMRDQLAQLA